MTNKENIQQMTTDELADFLLGIATAAHRFGWERSKTKCANCPIRNGCIVFTEDNDGLLDWLNKEREE